MDPLRRRSQCKFWDDALIESSRDDSVRKSGFSHPLSDCLRPSECCDVSISSGVVGLNQLRRPYAILLAVGAIVIDALKRVLWRAWSHVFQERSETIEPSLTNRDATSSVVRVRNGVRLRATRDGSSPRLPLSQVRLTQPKRPLVGVRARLALCISASKATRELIELFDDMARSALARFCTEARRERACPVQFVLSVARHCVGVRADLAHACDVFLSQCVELRARLDLSALRTRLDLGYGCGSHRCAVLIGKVIGEIRAGVSAPVRVAFHFIKYQHSTTDLRGVA